MEAVIFSLLNSVSGQDGAIAIVTLIVGIYLGMKITMVKASGIREDLVRKQNEIQYLAEENRKLRIDVRKAYKAAQEEHNN
jgi:xanthosine utilization system XapX-like protein